MARQKVKDELLEHDYDGIQELDNDLPPWWLYLFYFTIIYSVGYMAYYHVLGWGELQEAEYRSEMRAAEVRYGGGETGPEVADGGTTPVAIPMEAFTDDANLASGKEVYMTHCMPCHGVHGEGTVGPNMTDEYWVHGGTMKDIVNTINVGVPAKGMISWKPVLNPLQIKQVSSYILSLQGTNPPNPKAPEGEKVGG